MKFEIALNSGKKEVEGIPIKVKGYEWLPLFVYQHDGTYGLEKFDYLPSELKGKYLIGEVVSGFYGGKPADDPEEAYQKLTHHLKEIDYTEERYRQALESISTSQNLR